MIPRFGEPDKEEAMQVLVGLARDADGAHERGAAAGQPTFGSSRSFAGSGRLVWGGGVSLLL
jgi:hypothetical protein